MQKRQIWTAVSIPKELRGLCANFWTKKELNLNYLDRGLKLKKPRGSYAKVTRADRYLVQLTSGAIAVGRRI